MAHITTGGVAGDSPGQVSSTTIGQVKRKALLQLTNLARYNVPKAIELVNLAYE